jgi:hypothetical protein
MTQSPRFRNVSRKATQLEIETEYAYVDVPARDWANA